jgi:hypothetical protein
MKTLLTLHTVYLFHLPALKEGRLLEEQGLQVRREANQGAVYLGSLLNNSPTREAPYEYLLLFIVPLITLESPS